MRPLRRGHDRAARSHRGRRARRPPRRLWLDGLAPWRTSSRLTIAELHLTDEVLPYLARYGRAIRYQHVPVPWPIDAYQTVFAEEPGSAEMPSASRPFTTELVTRLVSHGVGITPITLHTGVSSLEGHEDPYPERFDVPAATAHRVADAHGTAVGSSRSAPPSCGPWSRRWMPAADRCRRTAGPSGSSHPRSRPRWSTGSSPAGTSPGRPTSACSKRSPASPPWSVAYDRAIRLRYRWHEFGDLHLILPA